MNKGDFIKALQYNGFSKKDSKKALKVMKEAFLEGIKKDKSVSLIGFGNFKIVNRKARKCRNPQTQEEMMTKEKNVVTFKVSKKINEQI